MFQAVLEWVCEFSPAIGASALLAMALIAIVLWRGGKVTKIKVPGLFEVELQKPVVFAGSRYLLYASLVGMASAAGLMAVQLAYECSACEGMPGQTAWIYGGQYDPTSNEFLHGPFAIAESAGTALADVREGTWVRLLEPRNTMILDYEASGLDRALDSPFRLDGRVSYTCKFLPTGTRLYVAQKEVMGPSPQVRHIWFRVRAVPPG